MAIAFTTATAGLRLSGQGLDNGPVRFLILARVTRDSAGGEGSGHIFSEENGAIRLGTRDATTLNLLSSRLGTNDNQMRLTVPAPDGTTQTLAILRGDTPGAENSRHAYYRNGTAESFSTVNSGVSFQSATGGDTGVGFRFGRNQNWDGTIEYLYIWRDVDPSDDLLRALSSGLHPSLTGLPRPVLALEFPGSVRALTGQSIVSNDNAGYEAGGGFSAYPNSPIYSLLQTPSTQIQYNLGKHKLQALPITIGAGVGV